MKYKQAEWTCRCSLGLHLAQRLLAVVFGHAPDSHFAVDPLTRMREKDLE